MDTHPTALRRRGNSFSSDFHIRPRETWSWKTFEIGAKWGSLVTKFISEGLPAALWWRWGVRSRYSTTLCLKNSRVVSVTERERERLNRALYGTDVICACITLAQRDDGQWQRQPMVTEWFNYSRSVELDKALNMIHWKCSIWWEYLNIEQSRFSSSLVVSMKCKTLR